MSYTKGEVVVLEATFTDDDKNAVSASSVTVKVRKPDDTTAGPFTPTETSTGHYEYEYPSDEAGQHAYEFVSSDGGKEDGTFYVYESKVD